MKSCFYVKDENGNYVLADMCRNCAFGGECGCVLNTCICMPEYENEEDCEDEEEE